MSQMPSPYEFQVIAASALETVVNELMEAHSRYPGGKEFEGKAYDILLLRTPRFPLLIECPECGRLLLFTDHRFTNASMRVYRPEFEDPGPVKTLRSCFEPPSQDAR